ncbi:hypothetical protein CTM61_03635 [Prevotella intermedia]|uniref:Uncharacterized protein n=1 Tax=Prevotella intermedia TaxID=28131 RepID=A0A2D3NGR3_PREIN|nr:hypothetical protein CTM50_09280 [Prevotella intermedia]ATV54588.1 hypothetical protein CTM61_03635 [Prevotella intermedia]PJF00567.1 hypothetical protein CUB97_04445 [Prevotella intermedia]
MQNLLFCVPKAAVLHGKSVGFAARNSRFRNAKTNLPFFNEIIFTKQGQFPCKPTLYSLQICGSVAGAEFIPFLIATLLPPWC